MRLELAEFPVRRVRIGTVYRYQDGLLELDGDDLTRRMLRDPRIKTAKLDVVTPGERVRVTGIRDVVEPRAKFDGSAQAFPGVLGPVTRAGDGLTHRLSGMAVLATAAYEGTVRAGTGVERSAILDMWGRGAEGSRFSSLNHLVLIMELKDGLGEFEAHHAIQNAEFVAARKAAEVTEGLTPVETVIYDLNAGSERRPRVALIQGLITQAQQPHSGAAYYGLPIRESLPTSIHPNELLDGAITPNTTRGIGYYPTTWDWQNHPLVLGLYREQETGRLVFAGMILERISYETHQAKEVVAHNAARLARSLRADAALITWTGSGNAFVEVMLTIRACERLGIKTVLVTYEYGGKDGVDSPLLFYAPESNAVVSTGSRDRWIDLPEPEKIVGPYDSIRVLSYPGAPTTPAQNALTLDARDLIIGGVDNWGRGTWRCVEY
jgi:glycine reductase complex component B subunit alpha and beta